MLIKIFSRFTTTKFPYNFKGLVADQSTDVSIFAKKFFGENIDEGFLPAYQNFLESIVSQDCEFVKEICDPKISRAFTDGLEYLKRNGKKLKLTYVDSCKSLIKYSKLSMHFFADPNKDLRDQKPMMKTNIKNNEISVQFYPSEDALTAMNIKRPSLEISLYICSPCILIIDDKDYGSQNLYHKVDFRTHSEQALTLVDLEKMQPVLMNLEQLNNPKETINYLDNLIGSDYTWRISNFDNYL